MWLTICWVAFWLTGSWWAFVPVIMVCISLALAFNDLKWVSPLFRKVLWRIYFKRHIRHLLILEPRGFTKAIMLGYPAMIKLEFADEKEFTSRTLDAYINWLIDPTSEWMDTRTPEQKEIAALQEESEKIRREMLWPSMADDPLQEMIDDTLEELDIKKESDLQ